MFFEVAIPDLSERREHKDEYRGVPIKTAGSLYAEELVPIEDYGIKGSSFYSKPNSMTGEPLPDVDPTAYVRKSVAERLQSVNKQLQTSQVISKLLGGSVQLEVKDALRSASLQEHLYSEVWPKLLKEKNPDWSDEKVAEELPNFIAKPKSVDKSPTPHMTGGAVDLALLRVDDDNYIDMGHVPGTAVSLTDYHEGYRPLDEHPPQRGARNARRVLYWVMSDNDFANNPTEFWHYSYGDQMWALFRNRPAALFGAVESAPDMAR